MNIFDVGIVLLYIMFFISGFKRGVIKELASLIGIVVVFVLSYLLKGYIGNIFCLIFPFFKFSGSLEGITVINIIMYQVLAFILIFCILLGIYEVVLKVSKWLQKIVNMTIILLIPSKILGGIVAMITGHIFMFIVFVVLLIPLKNQAVYYESKLVNKIMYETPILSNSTSKITSAVAEIDELGVAVADKTISKNDANLRGLDIILKYNITDKTTIERLRTAHKLDGIDGIDNVLNNY